MNGTYSMVKVGNRQHAFSWLLFSKTGPNLRRPCLEILPERNQNCYLNRF